LVQWCLPLIHSPSSPTVQFQSIQPDDQLTRLLHHPQLRKPRRPLHIRTHQKLHCTFQYWPWCTACCTMTLCLLPTPLSWKCCHPIQHWLHTCAQQGQVLEFRRMARQPTLAPNPNTNLSLYFRFYSAHSNQGQVDWFWSIFLLGQGGLEQVAQNNDKPREQHDIAAKNLALDWSNAAWSNHYSADCWVLAIV
jgi:hypothetical protein